MTPVLSWFEIPVADFARARRFYEAVLDITIEPMEMGPTTMGMLSTDPSTAGGAIVHGGEGGPSASGTLVYFNGGDDLSAMLARVEPAGGKVLQEKTDIGSGFGFYALFMDTEGNKLGMHSLN